MRLPRHIARGDNASLCAAQRTHSYRCDTALRAFAGCECCGAYCRHHDKACATCAALSFIALNQSGMARPWRRRLWHWTGRV